MIKSFRLNKIFKQEIIIVLLLLLFNQVYFEKPSLQINADGKGYYDYLPATFIYNDLHWSYLDTLVTDKYDNHGKYLGIYNLLDGKKVNKYFVGTAIMMAPFFGVACVYDALSGGEINGYSNPFQTGVYYGALLYIWLGLLYLRKFLEQFKINRRAIFISQVAIVFGTPILYYSYFQPSFSHIYSFAAISAFIYYSYKYYETEENKYVLIFSFLLGLIFLIRPVNVLIIFIIPFYFNSIKEVMLFVKKQLRRSIVWYILSLLIFLLVVFIQPLFWYLQAGTFVVNSYEGESFNFLKPELFNILFSYRKGLFVYSPILLFFLIGGTYAFVKENKKYKIFILLLFILIVTYVLSAWWAWHYSMSFGQRSFIEYLPIFVIFSAYFFNNIKRFSKILFGLICLVFIVINCIQVDQYSRYILHWEYMNKESYWKVFLKTGRKYEGLLWKKDYDYQEEQIMKSYQINETKIFSENCWCEVFNITQDSLGKPLDFNLIHVSTNVVLNDENPFIYLFIEDSLGNNQVWQQQFIFGGIEQQYFYKENNTGITNCYFEVDLPENYHVIKIGFKTEKGKTKVKIKELNINLINK